MRTPSERMRKNTLTLRRRTPTTPGTRPGHAGYTAVATLPCSIQPLGDTGRRQDARDEHLRQGSEDSLRVFVTAEDADAAGLVFPWAEAGDVARIGPGDRDYRIRGEPIPQRFADDGGVLSWSLDVDRNE